MPSFLSLSAANTPAILRAPCHGPLLGPRAADTRAEQTPSRNTPDIFLWLHDWQFRYAGPVAAFIASIRIVPRTSCLIARSLQRTYARGCPAALAVSSDGACSASHSYRHQYHMVWGVNLASTRHRETCLSCWCLVDHTTRYNPNTMPSSWSIVRSAGLNYCFVCRFRPARTRMTGAGLPHSIMTKCHHSAAPDVQWPCSGSRCRAPTLQPGSGPPAGVSETNAALAPSTFMDIILLLSAWLV